MRLAWLPLHTVSDVCGRRKKKWEGASGKGRRKGKEKQEMKYRNRKEMKRNNGKQYENNGEEMKTHCLPRLMHAGKCVCQLHLPLFSRLLLLPRRVSSLSVTPHFPPIAPPLIVAFPQIYGSHIPLPSVLATRTLISRSLSISPSPSCLSLSHSFHLSAAQRD